MATTNDPEAVAPVVEIADLQADAHDADPEALLHAALSKVRKRGGRDE